MAIGMLLDLDKCTACRGCQAACKEWNDLKAEPTRQTGTYQNPPDLRPSTWTLIEFKEVERDGFLSWHFFNKRCLHCTEAACVDVCPTNALRHNALGFVSFERDICNGCGYCAEFCPFQIPRMEMLDGFNGKAKASKCTFCQDRVTNGIVPACAKTCPTEAIIFGDRDALIKRGRERVAALKARGKADARLYGETELSGLGQMYVLPEKASFYGLPENPQLPATLGFWQSGVRPSGYVAVALTAVGLAFNWLTARKIRVARMIEGE